jgi:hypothetical protein
VAQTVGLRDEVAGAVVSVVQDAAIRTLDGDRQVIEIVAQHGGVVIGVGYIWSGCRPKNTEAYLFYLRGRYSWNKRTEAGFSKAIDYFDQAIEKDPSYAPAYAGVADSYMLPSEKSVD